MVTARIYRKLKNFWLTDSFGSYAVAFFLIVVASGILLAVSYRLTKPDETIAIILLSNSSASFVRNIHYWSAQLFLLFTILHIWEHLILSTEEKIKLGVWSRLAFSIFVLFFVMITGFILKGDADSLQALRIIRTFTSKVPFFGKALAYSLFGSGNHFELIYVHHIATATIFLIFIIIEHSKTIWARVKTFLYSLLGVSVISLFVTPLLKTKFATIVRGPWYFLGLQEIFHYLSDPGWALLIIFIPLFLFVFLPLLKAQKKELAKNILTGGALLYFALTIFAFYFRASNWSFNFIGLKYYSKHFQVGFVNPFGKSVKMKLKLAGGKYEGCLTCHNNVKGFSKAHNPQAVGCFSCHGGNPFTLEESQAHLGMIKIPGNLNSAPRSCGNADCHPDYPSRVKNSIMNRLSGVIAVDRFVFGETSRLNDTSGVSMLKNSPADKHLKQLCVSCHLGYSKENYGAVSQITRGGGCNACHLNYSGDAMDELKIYNGKKIKNGVTPKFHPSLSVKVTDEHCFGCHSRSSRISLGYEGYTETQLEPDEIKNSPPYKILEDGRVLRFVNDDVHHKKGLGCIDCHISKEVMGDGKKYAHKKDQLIIECKDCHSNSVNAVSIEKLNNEERKTFDLLGLNKFGDSVLVASKGNSPIINSFVKNGEKFLVTKIGKNTFPLKPPSPTCNGDAAHKSLSCDACHSSWAPQCIGCHTQYFPQDSAFDYISKKVVKGAWREAVGNFFPLPPTLGVRTLNNKRTITTFIPGMVLTIQKNKKKIFKRLFAPVSAHTISAGGRSCKSCHNNPLALGYGRGELKYVIKNGVGKWEFNSMFVKRKEDGLPEDAWIGFLENFKGNRSTRADARPFNLKEQKDILTIGACLTCHKENGKVMKAALADFKTTLRRISKKCVLPVWKN